MAKPQETGIVIISPVEWNFTWQPAQAIAAGLAQRGYGVVFLNPLPKRMPAPGEVARVLGRVLNRPGIARYSRQPRPDNVQVVNPISLPDINSVFEYINRVAFVPLLLQHLRPVLARNTYTAVISFPPFPVSLTLAEAIHPDLLIYACQTNWAADPLVKRARLREMEFFQKADLVLADSQYLYEHASRHHPNVRRLPAMVDFDLFHRIADESCSRRPESPVRCCYFGGVGPRIDIELLAKVSQKHVLRLIGALRVPMSSLAESAELIHLVPHPQLPQFLGDVDVFLLPYRVNEFTKGILPAKIFECFATGKPVVSTYLPSLLSYEGLVYISQTHEEFLANIERAVDEPEEKREQRIAVARENTTDRWMNELSSWILGHLSQM
jgi:glycosyltransferase involved in cell wall biosynthesis